jgi:hypothetical protein
MPLRLYRTYNPGVPATSTPATPETPVTPPSVPEFALVTDAGVPILTSALQYILVEYEPPGALIDSEGDYWVTDAGGYWVMNG